jgi:hypothetical protein
MKKTDSQKLKEQRKINRKLLLKLESEELEYYRTFLQLESANCAIEKLKRDNANLSIVMMEHLGCTEPELREKISEILYGAKKKEHSLVNPFGC